jgi:multiple sugar transport system substrate-binding protein
MSSMMLVAACGGGSSSPSAAASSSSSGAATSGAATSGATAATAAATSASGPKVTLTYWSGFTGGDSATYVGLVKEFNATHPNIQVKMSVQPWDTIAQKLPTALKTGSGPDIATPDYNVGTIRNYITDGLIAPIDDLIGTGPDQIASGVMPKTLTDGFTVNGHLYAAPANFATLMLYYNKTLFAAAGITSPPTTMTELRSDAVKLTNKGKQYGISLADNATIAMWPILIWADGGDVVDSKNCSALSTPATVSAVTSWASLIAKDGISPVGQTGQGADNLFTAGKAAMEINGPWAMGEYNGKVSYDVAPVPVGSSGKPVTLASTVPMVLSAKSKHKAAALTFFAWWLSKTAQEGLAKGSGYPPSRTDMTGDTALTANPFLPKFAAAASYARLYLPDQAQFAHIDTDDFSTAIDKATRGSDVTSVLKTASSAINQLTGCKS